MRILLAVLICAGLAGGCQSNENQPSEEATSKDSTVTTDNSLTEAEKTEGWQLLFDGASKSNFHSFNNKTDGSAWVVSDGTITLDTTNHTGRGDLVTNDAYDNFDLKMEWKIDSGGNSGILIYVQDDPRYDQTYHTGPEMQVLDNAAHPDSKIIKHRAGDLYDLITATPETVKPAGEWNAVEIISNNGALEFYLNGTKVVTTTLWDDNWKKMVAESKFKAWPDFGTFKTGHIVLQDHGDPVWYRNIKMRKL